MTDDHHRLVADDRERLAAGNIRQAGERRQLTERADLKPWPPSAAHHHGFLRSFLDFSQDYPIMCVDGRVGGPIGRLYDQRKNEWYEWYIVRADDLKGHPCLPPWRCAFTAMAEVLALADQEGVDASIVTGGSDGC